MIYNFSNRIAAVQPSAIREILKSTSDPNVISFAAGNPAPEAFPVKSIENIIAIIMGDTPVAALQYSVSEGYAPLREAARSFACTREQNLAGGDDSLIIVSGAQQGIDLTIKCLINEGDTVLSETPSFVSALNTYAPMAQTLWVFPWTTTALTSLCWKRLFANSPT
ncbi:MAG: aminotransferase class I/II-fold pyridoxal phosphate-dependent enzyme [Angelakisella sp.]